MDDAGTPRDSEKIVRNLKLILAYDGSEFAGWQAQPGLATIQGTLASAIGRLTGENVLPQGSGRTDAGVHALAQVASFSTASTIPVGNWIKALNDILPASIRVLDAAEAPLEFHARKSARAKTYRYRITAKGLRTAIFYTRLYNRSLRTGLTIISPAANPAELPMAKSIRTAEIAVNNWYEHAKLAA